MDGVSSDNMNKSVGEAALSFYMGYLKWAHHIFMEIFTTPVFEYTLNQSLH